MAAHLQQQATACFRRESTKQSCMSQCDESDAKGHEETVAESLDTDTTSMRIGEGLSCSLSRSGLGVVRQSAIDTFFNQSHHNY